MKYYNLLVISDLNLDNLNKKKDNIKILKTFTKMIDLVNLILNLVKELFINSKITSMAS